MLIIATKFSPSFIILFSRFKISLFEILWCGKRNSIDGTIDERAFYTKRGGHLRLVQFLLQILVMFFIYHQFSPIRRYSSLWTSSLLFMEWNWSSSWSTCPDGSVTMHDVLSQLKKGNWIIKNLKFIVLHIAEFVQ